MIRKNIDLAMSFEKIVLGIRLAQFFAKTHSSTNIFEYHTQSIQFYIKIGRELLELLALNYDRKKEEEIQAKQNPAVASSRVIYGHSFVI